MPRKKKEPVDNSLLAFLEKQNPEELIYFGTENGSNWIMVDTAENIIRDIDMADKKLRLDLSEIIAKNERELTWIPQKLVEAQEEIDKAESDDSINLTKSIDRLNNYQTRFVSSYNIIQSYTKKLKKWKPLKERDVVDFYPHTEGDKGINVHITGDDNGKFWTKNEYERAKATGK